MNNTRNGNVISSNVEQVIDPYSILADVAKEWLSILLLTLSAGIISYLLLISFHPLDYAASATMVVKNVDENLYANYASGTDVYDNLNYGADSASRLKNILVSKELKNTVAKELGLEEFQGNAAAQTLGESNLLEITVRSKSPYISYMEIVSILRNYTRFAGDLVGGTELTVLENPKVQEKPEHPLENVKYSIVFGAIVFVLICVVLAWSSSLRDTIHNSTEAENKVDAKLLATVMHEEKHRRGKKRLGGEKASILITDPVTSFQYTEDMRKLAARILNEMSENHQKVLLVSSAMENEGKSTVSTNIALAMSQINRRIVLVDMDFRKPSIYKILNMQNNDFKDFKDLFEGNMPRSRKDMKDTISSYICEVPGTHLSVVLNRRSIPQAVEKNLELIKLFIEELKEHADYIIIDTAPISLVSDAEELATITDTSIIVIRQHWIEAKEINDTIDALGGREHMLGCVFNNARRNSKNGVAVGYSYGGKYAK